MIKLIAGQKGGGKTKQLIQDANAIAKSTDGNIVFIDDDKRHIYDLHYSIRFVNTSEFPLANYREFVGFVYGILSQDNDITEIFVDGITNIIASLDNESLIKLKNRLVSITESHGVNFTITMNCDPEQLPEEIKALLA